MAATPFGVVVVGAGPRGTSALERLLARLDEHAAAADADAVQASRPLDITVVDPCEPGPGHVWAPGQPRYYLMNTPALFPTVAPARGPGGGAGLTFEQFRTSGGDGADLDDVERAELAALPSEGFPGRALYGAYLRHVFAQVRDQLASHPAVASFRVVRDEVVALHREANGYRLVLAGTASDGTAQEGPRELVAEAVVLAVGHVPAQANPQQRAAGERATAVGLHYQGPNVPADVDWGAYPAGEPVLVRGLGLNFFDAMTALTVGRGGRFEGTGAGPGRALEYRPSGREPRLHAASRRGAPYRAKPCIDTYLPLSVSLRHLGFDAVHELAADGAPGEPSGKVGFNAHIWPLLHRDVLRTYYATLVRVDPGLFDDPAGFLTELDDVLDAPHVHGQEVWRTVARELVQRAAPGAAWLDVPGLGHPFADRGFVGHDAYQAAVLEYLEADAASSARGEDDPLKMAIGALNAGRGIVKRFVAEGLLDDASRLEELGRWFEPLVEGLASGPPLQRIEELVALARAGVVQFIGPDPVFSLDEEAGYFAASSPWVQDEPVTARHMFEAMMPANRVAQTASPLLEQLQAEGLARPRPMRTAEGEQVHGSGFDVVGEPYRLVDGGGVPHRGVFVLGLQLSSVQWGTAIAAEAGAGWHDGARTLGDADAVATELLRMAALD
ncbi:FAD/NAD(P)-binding protein [Arthrobacter sp. JSM 101049]|uniref:FAD/NAD(P)-binding protein n=1 Tax=Arthrobacter sp. JSM 101049 TaxID=929097 RepID=UPI0035629C19